MVRDVGICFLYEYKVLRTKGPPSVNVGVLVMLVAGRSLVFKLKPTPTLGRHAGCKRPFSQLRDRPSYGVLQNAPYSAIVHPSFSPFPFPLSSVLVPFVLEIVGWPWQRSWVPASGLAPGDPFVRRSGEDTTAVVWQGVGSGGQM